MSSLHSEKRGFVTGVVQEEGAEKCQPRKQTENGAPVRSENDSKATNGYKVEVRKKGSRQIIVPVMEMETPGDVNNDEAARPTAVSRRRGERVRIKP